MNRLMKSLGIVAVLAAGPAFAHEQGDHAMGVVERVTPERLVVKTGDGHDVTFAVTNETRFVRVEKATRPNAVRVGERVVVHGRKVGGGAQAVEVKLRSERK